MSHLHGNLSITRSTHGEFASSSIFHEINRILTFYFYFNITFSARNARNYINLEKLINVRSCGVSSPHGVSKSIKKLQFGHFHCLSNSEVELKKNKNRVVIRFWRKEKGEESEGKESEGKESEGKESEGKESEGKESEGKESEGKESEGKESERKESERK
jgi:hypothetical protein